MGLTMAISPKILKSAVWQHKLPIRVYWEDTDAGGIVYYANYLKFMERGRSEMVRAAGIDQTRLLADDGVLFAVKRCLIDYLRPAKLGDDLEVATMVKRIGAASLNLDQAVLRHGDLLVTAEIRLACLNGDGQPVRLPLEVRQCLYDYEAGCR